MDCDIGITLKWFRGISNPKKTMIIDWERLKRKPAVLNFYRQTRGKVAKHNFLDETYALNTKQLFTRPDLEF